MWKHIRSIYERSGLDPEQMVAPKELWFDHDGLTAWFRSREEGAETATALHALGTRDSSPSAEADRMKKLGRNW